MITISDLIVIQGSIDSASLRAAVDWAREHRKELEDEWHRLNEQ
ncbi:DUF4160 domain-containing protein [Sinorhizobium saheli]|nr:hypothetical protein [Sinorhizobium saheli]